MHGKAFTVSFTVTIAVLKKAASTVELIGSRHSLKVNTFDHIRIEVFEIGQRSKLEGVRRYHGL